LFSKTVRAIIKAGGKMTDDAAKRFNPHKNISALESQIDQLVYALYALTEEEIKIVEGKE
jgi:hypothetical protein